MLRRRSAPSSPAAALAARPVRLVEGELTPTPDGGGRIAVPLRPPTRFKWLYRLPAGATKSFELDAVGLFVWNAIDGDSTVESIIASLAAEFRLNLRAAQVPTLQFLQTLMRKGLVGVRPTDDPSVDDSARG